MLGTGRSSLLARLSLRYMASASASTKSHGHVTVIGAGLMGSGIAQVSAQAGYKVSLADTSREALEKAKKGIDSSLRKIGRKKFADDSHAEAAFAKEILAKIQFNTDALAAKDETDLVVEAVVENLALKQSIFAKLDAALPTRVILASNTSSLSLKDIAQNVKRKDKFCGLHFFNPVPVMKLLEVVRLDATSNETFDFALSFGKKIGKTTIVCKDTPGFVVNRLLVPYMMEALRMYERGDATKEDIDTAMKLGAGYPMGPFELGDYVGLDTTKFIIDGWHQRFPDEVLFKPSPLLDKLVKEGKIGRKAGEGFYKY